MASFRVMGVGGGENPFDVFNNKTYISTGITSNWFTILSGGYCIKNGLCYVKMQIQMKSGTTGSIQDVGNNFPTASDTNYHSSVVTMNEIKDKIDDFFYDESAGSTPMADFTHSSVTKTRMQGFNLRNNKTYWIYSIYPTSET